MNEFIGSAFPGAEAGPLIAMDLLLRATIVLLLAYVVQALLGRRHALARSSLRNATLVALVFLPVAGLWLPRVSVAVLPARVPVRTAPIDPPNVLPSPDRSVPADTQVQVAAEVTTEVKPIASVPAVALPRAGPGQGRGIGIAGLVAAIYLAVAALFTIDLDDVSREADGDGVVRFDLTKRLFQDSLSFDVWDDGYVQQRYFFSQIDARYPKIPPRSVVELLPGEETLGGKVIDERGRPISRVEVKIWGYLGQKKDPHELAWMVTATTDEHGQWRCRCFRSMTFAYLYLSHPEYLSDGDSYPREHGKPRPNDPVPAKGQPFAGLRDFSDVQVMTAGVSLVGKVTDEHDKPVADAEVGWLEPGTGNMFHDGMPVTKTDIRGIFRFPHAPGKTGRSS
jgi:hypothetical protein